MGEVSRSVRLESPASPADRKKAFEDLDEALGAAQSEARSLGQPVVSEPGLRVQPTSYVKSASGCKVGRRQLSGTQCSGDFGTFKDRSNVKAVQALLTDDR